jgi:monoamine oxidase
MTQVDVVIIGAGAAGLAAASALRAAGCATLILEAAHQPGGRARTSTPSALGGAWIDEGAGWIHLAEHNPLVPLAEAAGLRLKPVLQGEERMYVEGRLATPADHAAYEAAETVWTEAAMLRAAEEPDTDLASASGAMRYDNSWVPTLEAWHSSLIDAVDAQYLSVKDWRTNQLDGQNLNPPDGFGRLLCDLLVPGAGEIRLNTSVRQILWGGSAVTIETKTAGTVEAKAVIVTVSTGVLRAGALVFDPPLPEASRQAIADLPMGLLSRVALRAKGADRLGLSAGTHAFRQVVKHGDPFMSFITWPRGADHVVGFFGGDAAWALAKDSRAATEFARSEWRSLFGSAADQIFRDESFTTDWGTDPCNLGAYSYARPGGAGARAALAAPVGERLLFAGEACRTDGTAGTVGGSVLDGRRAASLLLNQGVVGHR